MLIKINRKMIRYAFILKMKIKNLNLFVLFAFTISIASCVTVKAYEKNYSDEIKLGLGGGL